MGEWKLQRSRRQRYLVTIANRLDPVYPSDDLGWRRPIVPGVAPGENAGIQRTADHNRDPGRLAARQQIVERRLLEEGIAAGEKKDVPGAPLHRLQQHLPFVDADPDRLHGAATAQLIERPIAALAERAHDRGMRF